MQNGKNCGLKASVIADNNLDEVSDAQFVSNNLDGRASKNTTVYSINKEAKKIMDSEYGLGGDKMDNLYRAAEVIKRKDLEERKKLSDDPDSVEEDNQDVLGIVREVLLWPVFKMCLFTKKSLLVFAELASCGRLVTNLDSTGQLLQSPVQKTGQVSLHHMNSNNI